MSLGWKESFFKTVYFQARKAIENPMLLNFSIRTVSDWLDEIKYRRVHDKRENRGRQITDKNTGVTTIWGG